MNCPCGEELKRRQRMFCSVHCRNSANGKKVGGWNRSRVGVTCEHCGLVFEVPPHRLNMARACSRACLGALQSVERRGVFGVGPTNPGWKDGRSPLYYRRFLKDACERCGVRDRLLIHHRDHDRTNNDPTNLATWCHRCHQRHHGEERRDLVSGRYA